MFFGKTIAGKENLSVADLSMQRLYVDLLQEGVSDMKQAPNVHNLQMPLTSVNSVITNMLRRNEAEKEYTECCYLARQTTKFSMMITHFT